MRVAIIGAGLTGASAARLLADNGHTVVVYEKEPGQFGGATADFKVSDYETGKSAFVSKYGPHIFHTDNEEAYEFFTRFSRLIKYDHKVVAITKSGALPWPINNVSMRAVYNVETIEEANEAMAQDIEITSKIIESGGKVTDNFETIAKARLGSILYNTFIKDYTESQWRRPASELPASMFGRVRIEQSENNRFFPDKYVGLPLLGYSKTVEGMLAHKNISMVWRKVTFETLLYLVYGFDAVINTAPTNDLIEDAPQLPFNKVKFHFSSGVDLTPYGTPVVNINTGGKFTRMTDYWAMYNGEFRKEFVGIEEPSEDGVALYTIRTPENVAESDRQIAMLAKLGIISTGRMGGYKYINMDQAILLGLDAAKRVMTGVKP